MLEVDSLPTRLEPRHVTDNRAAASPPTLAAANQSSFVAHDMLRAAEVLQAGIKESDSVTVASAYGSSHSELGSGRRDVTMDGGRNVDSQTATPHPADSTIIVDAQIPQAQSHKEQQVQIPSSASNSQDTTMTTDTIDRIFTPPASEGGQSQNNSQGNGQDSSQESQLLQLSQLAAARERMPDHGKPHGGDDNGNNGASRKRMADGMVKPVGERTSTSPGRVPGHGHSRNISTVSVASTTSSRARDMGSEIKARLAYAMVKVNNGWQSHTIDQVEKLASQSTSPTSSNSTIHLRHRASASPQLSASSHRGSASSTPATRPLNVFTSKIPDSTYASWQDFAGQNNRPSPTDAPRLLPSLAPPVSIQSGQRMVNPRRNSHARHPPSLMVHSHQASPATGPNTPGQPSPYPSASNRTPLVDPALFSPHGTPHQNVREQDAMEALLFMSSPGNSANLKHNFPSSSQPARSSLQRTALPNARKSLPTGRPQPPGQAKRVGFQDEMDIDPPSAAAASQSKSRRINGFDGLRPSPPPNTVSRSRHIPPSVGLSPPRRDRKALAEADFHRMMAAVEANSDSEGEIEIPTRPQRTGVAPTVAH